jgi:hypothetical protein
MLVVAIVIAGLTGVKKPSNATVTETKRYVVYGPLNPWSL